MKNSKPYEIVIEKLIAAIESAMEKGEKLPWQMPWLTSGCFRNMATKHAFTGVVNLWMLRFLGEGCKRFATFKQIKSAGGTLESGSKGIALLRPILVPEKDNAGKPILNSQGKPKMRLIGYSYYTVFADKYIQGGKFPKHKADLDESKLIEFSPIEEAESLVASLEDLKLYHKGEQACFIPSMDEIHMPKRETFKTVESYYFTLFHEIGHWTRKRVSQDCEDCKIYAFEELCAEFTSCILATETGLNFEQIGFDNSAAYLKNWMEKLKANPNWLSKAARLAEKRAEYILKPDIREKEEVA